jgi:hypothetical protein
MVAPKDDVVKAEPVDDDIPENVAGPVPKKSWWAKAH